MTGDPLRDALLERVGQPMGAGGPVAAPDPVNVPMIRHWVDALDDRNPVYLDDEAAAASRFGGIVAPPAMLQVWTMPRPRIEGIRERGGAPGEVDPDSPVAVLTAAGFRATLATNSELEFDRYLRVGDRLSSASALESVSELKGTALGVGYFVTWINTYRDDAGAEVGRQRFRIFKFDPSRSASEVSPSRPDARAASHGPAVLEELPPFDLDVTATVVVAGALASRDFMPVHHDRDFARAQGAPDIFMNILTTNGYVARYVTDWAGPEAMLRRVAVRLGAPAVPGTALRFTGALVEEHLGDEHVRAVTVRATNDLGDHATATVELTLPV